MSGDVYFKLPNGERMPVIRLSDADFKAMKPGIIGSPIYINRLTSQVWPEPDREYELFDDDNRYCGTVGFNE